VAANSYQPSKTSAEEMEVPQASVKVMTQLYEMELCGYDEEEEVEISKSPPRESLRKLKVTSNNTEIPKTRLPSPDIP
jgi:hypothetical protein